MTRSMTRRDLLRSAGLGAASLAVTGGLSRRASGADRPAKPNIVFVFADQMRASAMGCMGNPQVITPNLDKLAAQGVLVTNGISGQPVCSPYRAQLLTGRYSHRTGIIHNDIRLPDSEIVISQIMKGQGYTTGYIGKWHLMGSRANPVDAKNRRGWDFWAVRNCSHQHLKPAYWLNDAKEPVKAEGWEPEIQTDLAVEFINKNKGRPFCLLLSFGPPHNPYVAPREYVDRYKGKTLKPRPNASGTGPMLAYYAMVTSLDECMGRIAAALARAGVAEDTILCFSSDHGDMLGSQGHRLKQRPWEESINVPFILRYPRKVKAGQRRDWIVSAVDVMPTLLGLTGTDAPKNIDGMDLSPLFLGEGGKERQAAFLFNVHTGAGPGCDWRGIRTKDWVYAYHLEGDWVMYDLKNDPYELHNRVDDPRYADRKKQLRQQLDAMRKELGEDLPLAGKRPARVKLPSSPDKGDAK